MKEVIFQLPLQCKRWISSLTFSMVYLSVLQEIKQAGFSSSNSYMALKQLIKHEPEESPLFPVALPYFASQSKLKSGCPRASADQGLLSFVCVLVCSHQVVHNMCR